MNEPTNQPASNAEVRKALEEHIPREENPSLWEKLNEPLGVADEKPIDLKSVWTIINTNVRKERLHEIWEKINRPIEWGFHETPNS